MRILIAPDKFKGSLSAREVAASIAKGLHDIRPEAKIDIVPMADGGEGTAEVICDALGGTWLKCQAQDPLGRAIMAGYAWVDPPSPRLRRDKQRLAVMEMSEAAGMRRLAGDEPDPLRANTFGVGEMILDATKRGAREIIIGLGGSATNDGGLGMARALGFRFADRDGKEIDQPSDLIRLERIVVVGALVPSAFGTRLTQPPPQRWPNVVAAVDVQNPLLGQHGATRVFGPQKGATAHKIDILERGLARLAEVVAKEFGVDNRDKPGAGAAGGLGFGLMSFCNTTIRSGFDVVAEAVGLESKMSGVDLVITGEGRLDRQTLEGKTPAGVARLAQKLGKRVVAIAGRADEDREVRELFDAVYQLGGELQQTAELLQARARELAKNL